jgi:hypothetical protein
MSSSSGIDAYKFRDQAVQYGREMGYSQTRSEKSLSKFFFFRKQYKTAIEMGKATDVIAEQHIYEHAAEIYGALSNERGRSLTRIGSDIAAGSLVAMLIIVVALGIFGSSHPYMSTTLNKDMFDTVLAGAGGMVVGTALQRAVPKQVVVSSSMDHAIEQLTLGSGAEVASSPKIDSTTILFMRQA